ncbi:MAG: hypothetical protein MZV49_24325 [Rhodopseudomonas palustris]|nr:hypothetical protein [Rhodopseudomonas palustris]
MPSKILNDVRGIVSPAEVLEKIGNFATGWMHQDRDRRDRKAHGLQFDLDGRDLRHRREPGRGRRRHYAE